MKLVRFSCLLSCFFVMCILAGCFGGDGGGGGQNKVGGDPRINGWYEATIESDSLILVITGNELVFLKPLGDSYTGSEGEPGSLDAGLKYSILSTADSASALGGTLSMDHVYNWAGEGSSYTGSAETGSPSLTATADNWYAYDNCKDPVDIPYEFTDATLGTLNIYIEGDKDTPPIVCARVTPPAADAKYAGSWSVSYTQDYDNDSSVENVRMDVSLNINGSFGFSKYDIDGTEYLVEKETGTWGTYRSLAGYKYIVLISESGRRWNGTALGEENDVYHFNRKLATINMFGTVDNMNMTVSSSSSLVLQRQGSDPSLPSLDSTVTGMWQGTEGSNTAILTMKSDGTFEKAVLADTTDGMIDGLRGHYMSDKGELYFLVDQGWEDNEWVSIPPSAETCFDMTYSISGTVFTMGGAFPSGFMADKTLDSIQAPEVSSDLVGTWRYDTATERTEIIMQSDGSYTYNEYSMSGGVPVNLSRSEKGTWGTATAGTTDYLYSTATAMDSTSNPVAEAPVYADIYCFRRTVCAVSGNSLTLDGTQTFTKQ